MKSSIVRIDKESSDILHDLAEREDVPMREILYRALVNYQRKYFLIQCADGYATLKCDNKSSGDEISEIKAWESTIADGLEKDK